MNAVDPRDPHYYSKLLRQTSDKGRPVEGARMVELIEVVAVRGEGVPDDPVRFVRQYYERDGTLIAESDPIDPRWRR